MKKHLWLIFIIVGLLLFFFGVRVMRAQVIAGTGLTIGSPPTTPGQPGKVRITGIGTENGPLFTDANGDLLKRALLKGDLPPGIAWLADTQTFTGVNTFTNGLVAPSIRAPIGSFTIRNSTDTAWVAMFLDNSITLRYATEVGGTLKVTGATTLSDTLAVTGATTLSSTLAVTGRSTLTGGYDAAANSSITGNLTFNGMSRRILGEMSGAPVERLSFQTSAAAGGATYLQVIPKSLTGDAGAAGLTVLNREDVANAGTAYGAFFVNPGAVVVATNTIGGLDVLPMQFSFAGATKAEMTGAGWKFYDKVGTTGLYSITDPFTIYATDTVTPIMNLFDAGRNVVRNTGLDTYWEYQAHGNAVNEKLWRAGIVGGQYRVDAGNDAGNTWSNLFRSSMANGIPNTLYWGTGVKEVTPDLSFETNLGNLTRKYLAIHAGELWVDSLVAQNTLATIGGRILVGPTTTIEQEFTTANNEWYVPFKYQVATGDILVLQGQMANGAPQVEFVRPTAFHGTCAQVGWCNPSVSPEAFYWTVQRDLDGSGMNDWVAGDAAFNTRQSPGQGFIDLYSIGSLKNPASEIGPTIVGNVRVDGTYNNWAPRWAIGNLAGLYQQGAAQTYGVAFGDSDAVHMIMDSTYGFRGKRNTEQKFVIHPSGYVMIGDSSAGVMNTYIDNGTFYVRSGTVPRTAMNATGVYNYDSTGLMRTYLDTEGLHIYNASAASPNIVAYVGNSSSRFGYGFAPHNSMYLEQTTGRMIFYSGTVPRIIMDAGNANISFYDTGGGYAHMQLGSFGANFGYTHGTFGNIHINTSGQLYVRGGTANRLILDNNGAMTWYDPGAVARQQIRSDAVQFGNVDQLSRMQFYAGNLQLFDNAGKQFFNIAPGAMYQGDWYTTYGAYMLTTPTYMQFCNAGVSCPLTFYGTSGDIHSAGNILLTGGGNITSSGNFTLGATSGLRFEVYSAAQYEANRAIQWFKAGVLYADMGMDNAGSMLIHSRTWGGGTGIRLAVGTSEHIVGGLRPGIFLTHEPATGYHNTNVVLQGISGAGNATMVQLVPLHGANSPAINNQLGATYAGSAWHNIYGGTYWSNGAPGWSGTVFLKNSAGVNYCQMNFSGGIMTGTNC